MEKNVIITGSNRGIGAKLVEICVRNGYNVWACSRKQDVAREQELRRLSEETGQWIYPLYFDISEETEIKASFKEIFNSKKDIYALINNAGVTTYNQPFTMVTMKQIQELYQINLFSLMYLTQLCLKKMIRQKGGNVINISSICGQDILPSNTIYGSSKAAVISFTRNLASEVGKYNIRINTVAPGPTYTDIIEPVKDYFEKEYIKNVSLKRLAETDDIANVVKFLLGDESNYITGQIFRVDGGKF